jgi:hypothetical protein
LGTAERQREIADDLVIRLQEFLDGYRDFEDAVSVEEQAVARPGD